MKLPAMVTGCRLRHRTLCQWASRPLAVALALAAAAILLGSSGRLWAGEASRPEGLQPQRVNVLVINIDPVLKTRGKLKLHEAMKWSDPWKLTERMVEDARLCSGGYVDYRVVEKIDYDWSNTNAVWTYADDWLTYPTLPRQKKLLNAATGGWEGIVGHHLWWLKRLPQRPGVTAGFYNNWWQYIVNYDAAMKHLPPPGATFQKATCAMYAE